MTFARGAKQRESQRSPDPEEPQDRQREIDGDDIDEQPDRLVMPAFAHDLRRTGDEPRKLLTQ